MLKGREAGSERTMNSSVCSYKHNCLHLLSEREAPPPLLLIPTPHPLLVNPTSPPTPSARAGGQMVITVQPSPLKPIHLLQDSDRTCLQTTGLVH